MTLAPDPEHTDHPRVRTFTGREIGSGLLTLIGLGILGSAVVKSPWLASRLQGPAAVDRLDVLLGYSIWAAVIGVFVLVLAQLFVRAPKLDGFVMLTLMAAGFVLADRYLLAQHGLPLWEHDPVLHYRHRPNVSRLVNPLNPSLGSYVINADGHHDDPIPVAKPEGELRGLMIGDSVTMGYGVTHAATFSSHLEKVLAERDASHTAWQAINTGVHGYSTAQERIVLEKELRFEPDFIVLGFCLNDVTEPFIVDTELGGTGVDYHAVQQSPSAAFGWVINETGFGRLIQKLQSRGKSLDAEKRQERYNVRAMALGSETEPRFIEAWKLIERDLEGIYAIAKREKKPLLVLVFPFTFQLVAEDALKTPQRIVVEHARAHGVAAIDVLPAIEAAIFDDPALLAEMKSRYDDERIREFYNWKIREYFFDQDHFTTKGNRIIAELIYGWLADEGLATKTSTASAP